MRVLKGLVPLSAVALLTPSPVEAYSCDYAEETAPFYDTNSGWWLCAGYGPGCTYCWDTQGGESCYTMEAWCCPSTAWCCSEPGQPAVTCAE